MSFLLATLLVIDLPLGPGSEAIATRLVSPHEHAQPIADGPWHLWDIRVQPSALHYAIGKPHEKAAVTVVVDLHAAADGDESAVTIQRTSDTPDDALAAANQVASTLRSALTDDALRFTRRAPAPSDHPVDVSPSAEDTPPPRGPPGGTPRWLAALLLLALATSLVTVRQRITRAVVAWAGRGWWMGLGLSVVTGALLWAMDDVVLHPNAHGWDTVRSVAGMSDTPFPLWDRYGALLLEVGRLFGSFAVPGHETFVTSRVSGAVAVFALYGFALAVLRSHRGALLASALLATSPVLLFVARGEALSASGLMLLIVTSWLFATAARTRDTRLLACGAIALACLASFRLMGPIMAPCAGLFALLPADKPKVARPNWWKLVGLSWLTAAVVASPHLVRMGWLMTAELGVRPEADVIPRTLLDSPMWTPFALLVMGAFGLIALLGRSRLTAGILVCWTLCAVVAPAASSAFYQDQARYQIYAVPALALAAAAGLDRLIGWSPKVSSGLIALWLLWFGAGQSLAGNVLATEQAEVAQLRAWRSLSVQLPDGAWLAVPVRSEGRAKTSLPDVELLSARPDIRIVSLGEAAKASGKPLFWFQGLSCAARYPADPPDPATDCIAAHKTTQLTPRHVVVVDPELPASLADQVASRTMNWSLFPGDLTQWNPRPFTVARPTVGLYELSFPE